MIAALAALAGPAGGAVAQGAAPMGREYGELIKQALDEFAVGNWAEARILFGKAHAIEPSARTSRSLGLVEYELRNYAASILRLRDALADTRRPLTPQQRAEAQRVLTQAERYVDVYRVDVRGAGVTLLLYGKPAELSDGQLLLNPGSHIVTAKRSGHANQTRSVEVAGAQQGTLTFDFESEPESESESESAAPAPDRPQELAASRGGGREPADEGPSLIAPIAVTAAGAALIIAGVATAALATDKESTLNELCRDQIPCDLEAPMQDSAKAMELQDDRDALALATNVLLIGGAVVAAAGGVWLVWSSQDSGAQARVVPTVTAHGAGIVLRGSL